ncbi:MAG: cobalamin-binding protein [Deltaproteobacteria bacterium]|nr:cobalamin-binding protein [Deltaproteobacteria bacterium]
MNTDYKVTKYKVTSYELRVASFIFVTRNAQRATRNAYFVSTRICFLIAILVNLCVPVSVVSADSGSDYVEIVDDVGRKVRVKKYPDRIVSLAPSNTEILFALGLGHKVVGVTSYCNFPPAAEAKEKVGGFSNPDIEKIIALAPDLLLADSLCYKEGIVDKLEGKGLSTIVLAPETLTGVLRTIQMVGTVTGEQQRTACLITDMEARIGVVTKTVSKVGYTKKPKVLYVTWHDPVWAAGSGILIHDLIERAGGSNVAADMKGWRILSLEEVLNRNPSVIIVSSGHGKAKGLPFTWTQNEPRLSNVDARKFGRVYDVDADLAGRFGPRIVEVLEQLAHYFHPDVFGEGDYSATNDTNGHEWTESTE